LSNAKPHSISKMVVFEAYKKVKANKGSEGIDEVTFEEFDKNLEDNLYKIWNRMSSGTYFPPPVRTVEIPKSDGKMRKLGIPTISDRIAQMVVKMYLEPFVDPSFHQDSYGYRPGKSMKDALEATRRRCWKNDWVIDLDIKGFFDNLDHELVMRAVRKHTDCKWILLYIDRWLKAPAQLTDSTFIPRTKGTPQGGVISPLLANLFLHHCFDEWMEKEYPDTPFARYADDIVVHCTCLGKAELLLKSIRRRFELCKLELHPDKTKIVYCRDEKRSEKYSNNKFDFLGYTFKSREAKGFRGNLFMGFLPAVGDKAIKKIRDVVHSWDLKSSTSMSLDTIAMEYNPQIRGWINHYGLFYKSALKDELKCIEEELIRWALRKYKKLKRSYKRARSWIIKIMKRDPKLFAHWKL
jgi:RNA-directed DNA polymerase